MKAVLLEAPERVSVVDVPEPVPGDGEALVRLHAGGICGSDLHVYLGRHPFRRPPVVLGHEVAGEVVAIGPGVRHIRVGDRVAVEPQITCGRCAPCARGLANLCEAKRVVGVDWPGMFSELIAAPEHVLYPIADHVPWEQGALVEPLAVVSRAVRIAEIGPGADVGVIGAGAIGALAILLCAGAGPRRLLVSDVRPASLQMLQELTGARTIDARRVAFADAAIQHTDGQGLDVAIVTAGAPGLVDQAIAAVRPGGSVIVVALHGAPVIVDADRLVTREVHLRGSFTYTRTDFAAAAAMINDGRVDVAPLVTRRVAMQDADGVFAELAAGTAADIKVVLALSPGG